MRANTQDSAWHIAGVQNSLVSSPVSQRRKSEAWENRGSDRSRGAPCRPGLHMIYPGISMSG